MNKNLVFFSFLSLSMVAFIIPSTLEYSPNLQKGIEKFELESKKLITLEKFDESLLAKICRSNIPPSLAGISLASIVFVLGGLSCIVVQDENARLEGWRATMVATPVCFIVGYFSIATFQYCTLKYFRRSLERKFQYDSIE
jgi:hypothetical protein